MGWFPARDKDNKVPPENLNWPAPVSRMVTGFIIKGKRAHQTMKGTRQKPLPPVGTPGYTVKTFAKLAVENARAVGFYNGQRIQKVAEKAVAKLDGNTKSK
jgi:hypothetical protein